MMKKLKKTEKAALINKAVCGFQIPMMKLPALYAALEAALATGATPEALKAIVAAFPGVAVA